jgi:hypothetical protein
MRQHHDAIERCGGRENEADEMRNQKAGEEESEEEVVFFFAWVERASRERGPFRFLGWPLRRPWLHG